MCKSAQDRCGTGRVGSGVLLNPNRGHTPTLPNSRGQGIGDRGWVVYVVYIWVHEQWMRPKNRGRRFLDPLHAFAHPGPPFLPVSLRTLHGSWLSWVGAREETVAVLGVTRTPPASARKQRRRAGVGSARNDGYEVSVRC